MQGFKSHGSAREIFDWDEMCNTLLPIPHIDKQREIVKEYNVIQNRIALNQQLIQKLEETAQAIYREWFVEGIDLENLPEGWKEKSFTEVGKLSGGGTPDTNNPSFWNGEIPFFTPADVSAAHRSNFLWWGHSSGNRPQSFDRKIRIRRPLPPLCELWPINNHHSEG
jgi:restriction endonuclease S subunit